MRIPLLLGVCFSVAAFGQDLRLIPTPQKVTITHGWFAVSPGTKITADEFLSNQIKDEIKTDFPNTEGDTGSIEVRQADVRDLPEQGKDEGYLLEVQPNSITITAPNEAGLFYGVQTLKQLFRANAKINTIPTCTVLDWPKLKYRGWQDDISRGPIPTLDYFKREIRTMSEVKENLFTMYTEHVFKLKKYPDIAPEDGITAEEVKELVEYAKPYHVEIAGNYQSFGHQAHLFSLPKYKHLGANSWAFNPASEETYKFLADVDDEICAAYPSPLFCISCDEVGGFEGTAADAMLKKLGPAKLYTTHINRVVDLLRKRGKTPMMWGDIAMQHPESINDLPKDLIVLPWTYGDNGNFDRWVKPYADRGYKFIVCPGASCWSHIWPNIDNAVANISDFTRDGAKFGALGQLNTTWRDDGETLFGYNYYPMLWGAEVAWAPVSPENTTPSPGTPSEGQSTKNVEHAQRNARQEKFDHAFDGVFYGLPGDTIAQANRKLGSLGGELSDSNTWRDPMAQWADDPDAKSAMALSNQLKDIPMQISNAIGKAKYNRDTIQEMLTQIVRLHLDASKVVTVGLLVHRPFGPHGDAYASAIDALAKQVTALQSMFVMNWNRENHPWWLDQNLPKFAALEHTVLELPKNVAITPAKSEFTANLQVQIHPLGDGEVHYTLDGSDPSAQSPIYSQPITLTKSTTVKARQLLKDGQLGPVAVNGYSVLRAPAKVFCKMGSEEGHIPAMAFDGDMNTFFWSNRAPRPRDNFNVVLDNPAVYHSITVTTGHPTLNRDFLEHGILEISFDGKEFTRVAEFQNGIAKATLPNQPIQTIRVQCTNDQKNNLVIREIDLE